MCVYITLCGCAQACICWIWIAYGFDMLIFVLMIKEDLKLGYCPYIITVNLYTQACLRVIVIQPFGVPFDQGFWCNCFGILQFNIRIVIVKLHQLQIVVIKNLSKYNDESDYYWAGGWMVVHAGWNFKAEEHSWRAPRAPVQLRRVHDAVHVSFFTFIFNVMLSSLSLSHCFPPPPLGNKL